MQRYFQEIRKNEIKLTQVEELDLISRAQTGCTQSRDKVFYAHARFAISEAKKRRMDKYDDELIQVANEGVLEAIQRFDVTKKNKFTTFAVWYIRSHINNWLNQNYRTIRLPSNIASDFYAGRKDSADYTSCISSDLLEEGILDNANQYIDSDLEDMDGQDYRINKILAFLPKYKREIILMRIGDKELSWDDIAKHFDCSRENVRHHYYMSIERIKKKYTLEELKHFFF